MNPSPPKPWERAVPWLLALALVAFYTSLRQANLTVDGAAFLTYYTSTARPIHPHHPLFGFALHAFIAAGRIVGASPWEAGAFQSAFFIAAACGVFFATLRRAVSLPIALAFAALLGLNAAAIESATAVEIHGVSLFASALLFAAYVRAARDRSPRSLALLFGASTLVAACHVGYALWPAACYLALGWRDRRDRRLGRAWLAQGAAFVALLGAALFAAGQAREAATAKSQQLFDSFWAFLPPGGLALAILREPLAEFAVWAGPLLFASPLGVALCGRERPDEARLLFFASYLFFVVYASWPGDLGTFHLPLFLVWGFFAALAVERLGAIRFRWALPSAVAGLWAHGWLFMLVPQGLSLPRAALYPNWMAAAFWLFSGSQLALGLALRRAGAATSGHEPSRAPILALALFASSAALLLAAYSRRPLDARIPDGLTRYCESFAAAAPSGARLLTAHRTFRPSAQTGRETLAPLDGWDNPARMAEHRARISTWLREASPERPLFLDQHCMAKREFIWGETGSEGAVDPPLSRVRFVPVGGKLEMFHRAEAIVFPHERGEGSGLYPPEDWGGVPARWTRSSAQLALEPGLGRVRIKLYVGHAEIAPERPVAIKFLIDGGVVATATVSAQGIVERELEIPASSSDPQLGIEVDPPWVSPDGRELGAALYPIEPIPEGAIR